MNNQSITIIVKPTSECNLRCKYCYHSSTEYEAGILEYPKLDKLIRLAQEEYDEVNYIWHGGEPLLCGVDYFIKIEELQKQYRRQNLIIRNSVQTNGTLLSNEFINFFKRNDFSISISLDGPAECNALRQSTEKVTKSILRAQKKGLKISTISVIHALNYDRQIEIYEFLKSINLPMKFNPIFNSGEAFNNPKYLLDTKKYIQSLKNLYDHWLVDQTAVNIDTLDQYMNMVLYGRGFDCIYGSCLYHWIGVDHDGNIFPCGRNFNNEYHLGTISKITHISDVFKQDNFIKLLKESIIRRSLCKNTCDLYGICQGGCNNNALIEHGQVSVSGGFLCEVLKAMYEYIGLSIDLILADNTSLEKLNPIVMNELRKKRFADVFEE